MGWNLRFFLLGAILMPVEALVEAKFDNFPTDIAVIGAGIGGASSAYYLRKLFGSDVSIDMYEPHSVGGRLATAKIDDKEFESGGSIIHPKNHYMVKFAEELGLKHRKSLPSQFALYNGQEFVFTESSSSLLTLAKLLWRYGWDCVRLNKLIGQTLTHFENIYTLQDGGNAYSSVEELLYAMGGTRFVNMTQKSVTEGLKEEGFSARFINELAMAAMRENYGQTVDIPFFVGAVSLAGAQEGLWAVEGGNKRVPEELVKTAKVNLIPGEVSKVMLDKSGDRPKFLLQYQVKDPNDNQILTEQKGYDIVIVATPLNEGISNITFADLPTPLPEVKGKFHRTVANFVQGKLNAEYFGILDPKSAPTGIMTVNADILFNSIGKHNPVTIPKDYSPVGPESEDAVWKVFSQRPLTDSEIGQLFTVVKKTQVVDWLAYPRYTCPGHLGTFVLHDGLYYVNNIEWAASAMEMSAIGGRNVALLSYNWWHGLDGKVDPGRTTKTEL
ncbi:PCYOX1L [Branchiostoma lanceolatum]|uniref:PCYOX1L protein n=2 Tax=Branchiostoma lanceolatum TaxID=7740 RepID=A0A8J9ZS90_BRALA|nr:PCYOX1L [Branchiostoma lanceolatum]